MKFARAQRFSTSWSFGAWRGAVRTERICFFSCSAATKFRYFCPSKTGYQRLELLCHTGPLPSRRKLENRAPRRFLRAISIRSSASLDAASCAKRRRASTRARTRPRKFRSGAAEEIGLHRRRPDTRGGSAGIIPKMAAAVKSAEAADGRPPSKVAIVAGDQQNCADLKSRCS
jgi:hypothetical protein